VINRDKLYIGGEWVPSSGTSTVEVINATSEEVMGRVPSGTKEDVERAVAAARAAFLTWSRTPVEERAAAMQRVADGLKAHTEEIATVIAQEMGMPVRLSQIIQVGQPFTTFSSMPQLLAETQFEERIVTR
jgi:acyl-CoA reductase-like NAD-dependent aldehyde dehydrogenase